MSSEVVADLPPESSEGNNIIHVLVTLENISSQPEHNFKYEKEGFFQ